MDSYLINYLRSGKAWVFVGSGPSNSMGYPNWKTLAEKAVKYYESNNPVSKALRALLEKNPPDYPSVFQQVADAVTMPELLRELRAVVASSELKTPEIYDIIASWPVPVYLTTNYDDQLQKSLANIGESFTTYHNSIDHMALLNNDLNGAIFKLHGDLRSSNGLILTSEQYTSIVSAHNFDYWRKRMEAIMQLQQIVIIGHSLSDPNIRHILEIAKLASGVEHPICWITDDSNLPRSRSLLNDYRIRVINYPNTTGSHEGLLPLLRMASRFIPPRSSVVFDEVGFKKNAPSHTASALYVFNKLGECKGDALDRLRVLTAAIAGGYKQLQKIEPFSLNEALIALGWPSSIDLNKDLSQKLEKTLIAEDLLEKDSDKFLTTDKGAVIVQQHLAAYNHIQQRFIDSLQLRIKSSPLLTSLSPSVVCALPSAIDGALSRYFEKAGVSFATMLRDTKNSEATLPLCILEHIKEESTQFDNFSARQAFCALTLDIFCEPRLAEKQYLGRISEGFFAFHSLGVFGAVKNERQKQFASTVWLLDSNVLIHLLAKGYMPGLATQKCIDWIAQQGLQLFTTVSLFNELCQHLNFAINIVKTHGEESHETISAALGNSPYSRSNAFLNGFIQTKASGKCSNWEDYCISTIGVTSNFNKSLKSRLADLGVMVLAFCDWPGFDTIRDYGLQEEFEARIVARACGTTYIENDDIAINTSLRRDPREKAKPESEALVIVEGERSGQLNILGRDNLVKNAWFVSDTSILNAVFEKDNATWHSVSFERYISSLMNTQSAEDVAFASVVETIAKSGYTVISEKALERAFDHLIDEANLSVSNERLILNANLSEKYAEPIESVLTRLLPIERPLAALQLKSEALQSEIRRREATEASQKDALKELSATKQELNTVSKYIRRQAAKSAQKAKKQKRKQLSGGKKKKKKNKKR